MDRRSASCTWVEEFSCFRVTTRSSAMPTATSTIMLQYDFMRIAFMASAIVAIVAGCVGYFLVLRGQTFSAHALDYVGFTRATGAFLIGVSPLAGLVLLTVAAGLGMGLLGDR